jgi:hypothetical protein
MASMGASVRSVRPKVTTCSTASKTVRDSDVQTKLMIAVNTYNPLSEAVLEFVDQGVSSVVVVGEKGYP